MFAAARRCLVPLPLAPAAAATRLSSSSTQDAAHELLTTRRTTSRKFEAGRPIPHTVLLRAVEAAVHAPNHKLTEPWRFVFLGPEASAALGQQVADHIGGEKGVAKQKAWARVPSWIVALVHGQTVTATHTHNLAGGTTTLDYTQLEDYAATCCAVQNMTLYELERFRNLPPTPDVSHMDCPYAIYLKTGAFS